MKKRIIILILVIIMAMLLITPAFAAEEIKPHRWYESAPAMFIAGEALLLLIAFAFQLIKYIIFYTMLNIDHYNAYYNYICKPRPKFRIRHFWSGPHRDWVDPDYPDRPIKFHFDDIFK